MTFTSMIQPFVKPVNYIVNNFSDIHSATSFIQDEVLSRIDNPSLNDIDNKIDASDEYHFGNNSDSYLDLIDADDLEKERRKKENERKVAINDDKSKIPSSK